MQPEAIGAVEEERKAAMRVRGSKKGLSVWGTTCRVGRGFSRARQMGGKCRILGRVQAAGEGG